VVLAMHHRTVERLPTAPSRIDRGASGIERPTRRCLRRQQHRETDPATRFGRVMRWQHRGSVRAGGIAVG
jgi:hypothetical protein